MSRFRRRLMGLAALRPHIKDEFVRVEYIESNGTQGINTNVLLTTTKTYKIDAGITILNGAGASRYIFSTIHSGIQVYTNGNKLWTQNVYGTLNTNTFAEIESITVGRKSTLNCFGYSISTTYGNIQGGESIWILYNNEAQEIRGGIIRLYKCKIYEDDVLVRNFIPVLNKTTDEYGMYDLVEQKFYTSPNGAKFVGGREIIYDAEIEYLESTGTQWIDTGVYHNEGQSYAIDIIATPTKGESDFIATRIGNGGMVVGFVNYFIFGYNRPNSRIDTESFEAKETELHIEYEFKDGNRTLTVNGISYSKEGATYFANSTIRIYGGYQEVYYSSIKCKRVIFRDANGNLLIDMIPVRVGNVGYMYDKVSGELFGNDGSGEFILGKDVEVYDELKTDICEVHPKLIVNTYINENTGAQQNYGGWTSTDYIDIEGFKYAMIKISGSNLKYGAYYDKDKKKVGSTTSQVIPTTTKYVRYSTTTSNITNKNVFLFKKVVESSTPYLNNKYINKSGEIANYNGWSVFAEYNYNYVGYNDGYDGVYQASYNANGSKHQYNGYILLERPLGGKVYLSKSGTNITYGIGNKLEYKNMNE